MILIHSSGKIMVPQLFLATLNYNLYIIHSLSNDGISVMSNKDPNYNQVKSEFEALFKMDDPTFEETNYKQFVTMAM